MTPTKNLLAPGRTSTETPSTSMASWKLILAQKPTKGTKKNPTHFTFVVSECSLCPDLRHQCPCKLASIYPKIKL
jgi:hypothetical protein